MDVEMRNTVTEHEAVHVLGACGFPKYAAEPVHRRADRGRFLIGEVTPRGYVPSRLDHQVAEGSVVGFDRMRVPHVHERVGVDHAARNVIAALVLVADEALDRRTSHGVNVRSTGLGRGP
jgi:hypothetical protein